MFSVNMNLNLQDNVSFKVRNFGGDIDTDTFVLTITETDTIYNNNQVIFLNRDQLKLLYDTIGGSLTHD